MGVGHVPAGPFRQAGEGDDVPRRQHRGARADDGYLNWTPARVAACGEAVARSFLRRRGITVIGHNVRVGRSEIDIVGREAGRLVGFEVKAVVVRHPGDDGIHRVTSRKLAHVRRGVRMLGSRSGRVDVVTVRFDATGAAVRWIRDARW